MSIEIFNLNNLFSQTPEMFCILSGPEHTFQYVNAAHIKVLGFDATGMNVREAQPESIEVHGILDRVYQTGETAHLREIPVTVGNTVRYFDLTYAAKKDEKNNVNGVLVLGKEITEQVNIREKLKLLNYQAESSLKKLISAVQHLSEGMVFADANGDLFHWNPAALQMHGFTDLKEAKEKLPQFPEMFILENVNGEKIPLENWPSSRILRGEKIIREDLRMTIKGKKGPVLINFSGTPVYDEFGVFIMAVLVLRDVTEEKRKEAQIQESLKIRDEFLSVASHELKTPLTSMKLQTQSRIHRLKKGEYAFFDQERLTLIFQKDSQQLDRINRLVDDMLDISRITSGKLSIRREVFDLREVLKEMVERHMIEIQQSKSEVVLNYDGPVIGNWDRFRIEQVITNLLNNAIKYGNKKKINISVQQIGSEACLIVQDYGIGIAKEFQLKIFDRFERAISASEVSGLGLGLYIVKEILQMHGGRITVESDLGQGSKFIVNLPLHMHEVGL